MKIGFTGPYSDNNLGDYAMFVNDVMEISSTISEVEEIIIFTYNKEFIQNIVDSYLEIYPIKIVELKLKAEVQYVPNKSKKFEIEYVKRCMLPQEVCDYIVNSDTVENYIRNLDVVILGGGGCMNYYWLARHRLGKLVSILTPLILARRNNKRIITLGNTFGPWGGCKGFFELMFQYIDFDFISVRDDMGSITALQQIGQNHKIRSVIDDLYFLDESLKTEDRLYKDRYMVLELYSSMAELEAETEKIRAFAKSANEQGIQVVFLAFGQGFGGELQGEYLKKCIPEIVLLKNDSFLKIEDAWNVIKYAEYVICDRYHALVLATAAGTDCIMYLREIDGDRQYYFNKSCGFLKKVLGESYLDESDFLVLDRKNLLEPSAIAEKIRKQRKYILSEKTNSHLKEQRTGKIKEMAGIR